MKDVELRLPGPHDRVITVRHNDGAGPAVLLVHGAGGNRFIYDELGELLQDFSIWVPSLPGRTGTDGEAPRTAAEAATFLNEVVRALGLNEVALVGHSYGGGVVIEYALRFEARAIVLVATGARLRVHPAIFAALEYGVTHGHHAPVPDAAFGQPPEKELVERIEAARRKTPAGTALADWQAANAFDRMNDLASIRVPALIVSGTNDTLTPLKYAQYMAERVPGARLEVVGGAGHMLPHERPAEFAALLRGFLAK